MKPFKTYLDEDQTAQYIFAYGTLRRHQRNYYEFDLDKKLTYIYTAVLRGYKMYDLGGYPCIVETGNNNDKVVGDLFKVKDQSAVEAVRKLELNAGYIEKEIEMNDYKVITFIYEKVPENPVLIPSGSWKEK